MVIHIYRECLKKVSEEVSEAIFQDARRECPIFLGAYVLLTFCLRFAYVMRVKLTVSETCCPKNLDTFCWTAYVLLTFCLRYAGKVQLFSQSGSDTAPQSVMKKLEEECPKKMSKVSEKCVAYVMRVKFNFSLNLIRTRLPKV